jgi:ribonuclease P protein component
MNVMRYTFHAAERLKSEVLISRLFKGGKSLMAYPFRVVWLPIEEGYRSEFPVQVAISVPKRVFKTAVQRNTLKRRIREAYRLHKHELYDIVQPTGAYIALMLVYVAKEPLPFSDMESGVRKMIRKMSDQISSSSGPTV